MASVGPRPASDRGAHDEVGGEAADAVPPPLGAAVPVAVALPLGAAVAAMGAKGWAGGAGGAR